MNKYLKISLQCVCLLLLLSQITFTQSLPIDQDTLRSINNLPTKPYVSVEGKFSILLPETNNKYIWKFKEGEIRLKFFDIGHFVKSFNNKDFSQVVNHFSFDSMASLKSKELEKLSKLDEENKTAITYYELDDGGFGIQKYKLLNKRFYVVLATFKNKTDEKLFVKVLNSFEVTDKTDHKLILSKIYKEITPKPLPQNPIITEEKNDLVDDNLKGKVKQIKKYLQPIKYTEPNEKYLRDIYEYDRRGYLVKAIGTIYFSNLYSVKAYGFINQRRVYNVYYKYYNLSLFTRPEDKQAEVKTEKYLKPKYDSRYVSEIEKKYKDNKLYQRIFYNSAGRINYRRVFEYNENKVTAIGYDNNGNMIMKTISTFNKNGDHSNQIRIDRNSTPPWNQFFEYEYDNRGNWVKKLHMTEYNIDGVKSLKKSYVEFREIQYY